MPTFLRPVCQKALPSLSEIYFDMQPPRGQGGNFMQEMLGNLMGGGASSADNKSATPAPVRHAPPPRFPKIEGEIEDAPSAASLAASGVADDELDLD